MTMRGGKTLNKTFLIAAAVLLVIGFAVAVGVTLSTEPLTAGLPEGETTVTGDPLPTYAGQNDDNVSVGLAAPIFSGPNENSEIISLEKNGNAKALLFLAHWCGFCQDEVPSVQEWIDTIGVPDGVDIIAVATSIDRSRGNYPPQEWLERERWSETQIYDLDKEIGDAYGLTSFPYWVFLDSELNVKARRTGNLPQDAVGQLLLQLALESR
jgi:thiol-disulfide isomerase/thioredoxin